MPSLSLVKNYLFLLLTSSLFGITSCADYAVTLNNQSVYNAPTLLEVELTDPQLNGCIRQTIEDHKITEPEQLHSLACTHAGIESLEGIEVFTQLQQLILNNNQLTNVTIISELLDLQRLDLTNNPKLECEHIAIIEKRLNKKPLISTPKHCES